MGRSVRPFRECRSGAYWGRVVNGGCRADELSMNRMRGCCLRLFGTPGIECEGEPVRGRATQRHRIALLALLAAAPGQRLSRDKLVALLWPESDGERGRNLLSVSTYVIRSALGERALATFGDDLRLDDEAVTVDVRMFEAALDRGDHAAAAAVYRGPFLDGFFLADASEFEQWATRERERLATRYAGALEALASAAEADGDRARAVEWWRTRAAHDPYDSRVAARLMQALDAIGNRAGALQHAAVHQRLLEAEFGVSAAPEVAAVVDRLRREAPTPAPSAGGYQDAHLDPRDRPRMPAAAPVEAAAGRLHDAAPPAGAADVPPRQRRRRAGLVALLAAAVVASTAWMLRGAVAEGEHSIVVLPFAELGTDDTTTALGDGITEEIITRLSAVQGLKVISRTSAMHFRGSSKPLREIAAELGVNHVLTGTVRRQGEQARISAQLIDARADDHVWARQYDHELRDVFGVQERIAREVVHALEVELGDRARAQLARQGTSDPEAYALYRRGRYFWNTRTREGHAQAIAHYERAIARDSGYADAYAGLADAHLTAFQLNLAEVPESESYARATWAAERALALDGHSADARVAHAVVLWWRRDWRGAERELHRAIELNPGHATARSWYSLLLAGMGRGEEALRESRRASELDPLSVIVTGNVGWHCYLMRDFDCALAHYRAALEVNPSWGPAHRSIGMVEAVRGRYAEAIRSVERAIALEPNRPDYLADLAYVYALAGRTAEARRQLVRAKARPLEGFNIARAYAALGQPDSAFVWLGRSSWQWPHRAVRSEPALAPLHADPRFASLVEWVDRAMGMR